ncbi:MAG: sarcosine oxidase subunit gamma family protein [Phyllobacterium sp.]|uniref:sarcosine oxidase subunit gamma family protein n=1 Tax=Phyllobacterium sp. TaxID=1871046 RepID=UPI0030F2B022
MVDFRLSPQAALEGKRPVVRNSFILEALPEGHVVQVLANPCDGNICAFIASLANGAQFAVRAAAPGQWFIVGDNALSHAQMQALCASIPSHADAIDQSHGRVRISARGSAVRRVLAKGTAVDLSPDAFAVGHATTTLITHVAAHVSRTGENAFEIMVLRGFAESLWDDLDHMSRDCV